MEIINLTRKASCDCCQLQAIKALVYNNYGDKLFMCTEHYDALLSLKSESGSVGASASDPTESTRAV